MSLGPRLRASAGPASSLKQASGLGVGDRVRFKGEKQARWKVRARSSRYIVLTQPFNLQDTVLYTVIDLEWGIRGATDSWACGFETPTEIQESLRMLDSGDAAVSMRNSVSLVVADVKPARSQDERAAA